MSQIFENVIFVYDLCVLQDYAVFFYLFDNQSMYKKLNIYTLCMNMNYQLYNSYAPMWPK